MLSTLDALGQQLDAMWLERVVGAPNTDGNGNAVYIVEESSVGQPVSWMGRAYTFVKGLVKSADTKLQDPKVQVAVGVGIAVFAIVLASNPVGATAIGVIGVAWGTYNLVSKLVSRWRTYKKSGHSAADRG